MDTLKKLKSEEFKDFKYHLQEYGAKDQRATTGDDSFPVIAPCDLEHADKRQTVDLITQTYNHQPLEVTQAVLKKAGRPDLVEELSKKKPGESLR